MKQFVAFFKKEYIEFIRSSKCMIITIIAVVFGILSPAIAKLMPWIMEMNAQSMEGSGIIFTEVSVDAMHSWAQYFKNIPKKLKNMLTITRY